MLHLENFFEKSFALLLTTPKNVKNRKKQLTFCLLYTIIQHVERQTTDALLAQLVEHLTLNQGVQGSSPWRRIESTGFEDTGASGLVLFLYCKNWKQK